MGDDILKRIAATVAQSRTDLELPILDTGTIGETNA